jgi:GNAT superfamily N-acetyltransferase
MTDDTGTDNAVGDTSDDTGTDNAVGGTSDDTRTDENDTRTDETDHADDADDADDGRTDPIVRHGREGDLLAALRVLEGAMLEIGATQIRRRTESGEVLVAEVDGRVVGALVRDGDHVEAIAVHPDRRGTGIGRALIEAALDETGRLTAEFRAEVRPFYESLGFEIEDADADADESQRDGRLWGECVRPDP